MKWISLFGFMIGNTLLSLAVAADWSTTEIQFARGNLLNPFTGKDYTTYITTLQHASGWKYGDNFFFIDYLDDEETDGFNDSDYYGEWYPNFSLGKITGKSLETGFVKDVGVLLGINLAGDANVRKYLPGVRLSWNIPGFSFLNTDLTAYIDDSKGEPAPKETDSFMFDINGAYPFELGNQSFSIEGHIEYIGGRDFKDVNGKAKNWLLAQPQFRWDVGKTLFSSPDRLFMGVEYQYWKSKLGTAEDENILQLLGIWRF